MQSPAQITTALANNLGDARMHAIALFIYDLLERKTPEVSVPRYRIMDTNLGTPVTTVGDFVLALSAASMKQTYPYEGEKLSADKIVGFNVIPMNLEVRFSIHSQDDQQFAQKVNYFAEYGAVYRLCFYMAYMNDGDDLMPLKVCHVRLVS